MTIEPKLKFVVDCKAVFDDGSTLALPKAVHTWPFQSPIPGDKNNYWEISLPKNKGKTGCGIVVYEGMRGHDFQVALNAYVRSLDLFTLSVVPDALLVPA